MKQNHFFIPYFGNKRQEVERIYNEIKDELPKYKTIIEPFCGSSALSYYISTKHPKQFKYIINDNNENLIKLYKLSKNKEEFDSMVDELVKIKDIAINKEEYNKIVLKANDGDFNSWIYINRVFFMRVGCFPTTKHVKNIEIMKDVPILEFMRNEDIEILNNDALEVYDKYKNDKKTFIFLDPPYFDTDNSHYIDPTISIYEKIVNDNILKNKALICICVKHNWIINLLFKQCKMIKYGFKYQTTKKDIEHVIIINKKPT